MRKETVERIFDEYDFNLCLALWLIFEYDLPVNNIKGVECPSYEEKINGIALTINDIVDSRSVIEAYYDYSDDNPNKYINFVQDCYNSHVIFSDHKKFKLSDSFKKQIMLRRKTQRDDIILNFVNYLCDCLLFDRSDCYAAKDFFTGAKKFAENIENNYFPQLKNSVSHWRLLIMILSAMEDIDNVNQSTNKDNNIEILKYAKKAFEVRQGLSDSFSSDPYFSSDIYAVDLNNLGYSLLQAHRNGCTLGTAQNSEKIIREIFAEAMSFYKTSTNIGWKALIISNLGAVEGIFGNYFEAVRYDLKALEIKNALIQRQSDGNFRDDRDLRLTKLKSHLNIVSNSSKALRKINNDINNDSDECNDELRDKIQYYCELVGIHAIESKRLRYDIEQEDYIFVKGNVKVKPTDRNEFPDEAYCIEKLQGGIRDTKSMLDSLINCNELIHLKDYIDSVDKVLCNSWDRYKQTE